MDWEDMDCRVTCDGYGEHLLYPGLCGRAALFADNGNVNTSNFPNRGGNYNNEGNAGPFYLNVNNNASNINSNIGARNSCESYSPTFSGFGGNPDSPVT